MQLHGTCLLDLPDDLLGRCIPAPDTTDDGHHWDVKACMAVCHRLLAVLLKGCGPHQPRLCLCLATPEDLGARRATLLRAARSFPGLAQLSLQLCQSLPVEVQLRRLLAPPEQEGPSSSGTGRHLLKAGAWLPDVTCVWLNADRDWWGDEQPVELPVVHEELLGHLDRACPHLTHLHLEYLKLLPTSEQQHKQQQQQEQLQHLPHLQHLTIASCEHGLPAPIFKRQLQAWPRLQHLVHKNTACPAGYAAAIRDALCCQLRSLRLHQSQPSNLAALLLSSRWPQLQQLSLQESTVDDAAMELILPQLPQLQLLRVEKLDLHSDYGSRPCSWEVEMYTVGIASLARLPWAVRGVSTEEEYGVELANTGNAAEDLWLTIEAVTRVRALAAAEYICVDEDIGCPHGYIGMPADAPPHMDQVLRATLPLLRRTPSLELDGVHVTQRLLTTIRYAMPECEWLHFHGGCTFEVGIWGSLLSLVPYIRTCYFHRDCVNLQQLTILCATAARYITLGVSELPHDADADDQAEDALVDQLMSVIQDMGSACMVSLRTF